MILLTEAPDEIYRLGLLETIFMEYNSGSHLPPQRDLLPTPMHSKYLQWYLEHRKYSIKYLLNQWSWGLRLKRVLLGLRLGVWSCGQPHPTFLVTEEQRKEETKKTWRETWKVRIWAESPTKLQTIIIEYISLFLYYLQSISPRQCRKPGGWPGKSLDVNNRKMDQ